MGKSVFYLKLLFVLFVFSKTNCLLRSEIAKYSNSLLVPVNFNNATLELRILPFLYYGYISRLSLSNLNSELVEERLEEIYPFLDKKKCGNFNCLFVFEPKAKSSMTVTTLSWLLSFATLSSNVSPILLQYSTGLSQALFFGTKLSYFRIIISPVQVIRQGEIFASVNSAFDKKLEPDLLISPCDGVLQYIWPNLSTPSVAFMLIARIQCNREIKEQLN